MHPILSYFTKRRFRLELNLTNNIALSIFKSSLLLVVLFSLHIGFMMSYESLGLGDAIWLTLTTATTVGYGDISATTTEGRLATIFLIYLGGIFILARVVGDYFDYRLEVRNKKLKGYWKWHMKNHIVILNTPSHSGERYMQRLIKQFKSSAHFENTPIYVLTRRFPDGLPNYIIELGNVIHFHGSPGSPDDLKSVCVNQASDIIVLSKDEHDDSSDGRTFDILHRLKELKVEAHILAECVIDANRKRLQSAGANIVIRPIRAYPEMIVRAFDVPGSEQIIENMFNSEVDKYRRYDIEIKNVNWCDVVSRLITNNAGIAVAYIDQHTNEMVYNPAANTQPDIQALIAICREDNVYTNDDIRAFVL